jgi:sialidase-1
VIAGSLEFSNAAPRVMMNAQKTRNATKEFIMKRFSFLMGVLGMAVLLQNVAIAQDNALWTDPRCTPFTPAKFGPFARDAERRLLTVDKNVLRSSADEGKTWSEGDAVIDPGLDMRTNGHTGQILRTKDGTLVILFLDFTNYKFVWDDAANVPKPECKLEMWSIRSTDGGKTWTDKQRLLDGYNADFMGFIQLSTGRLVTSMEHLMPELCHWVGCSFFSDDEGKTWKRSNWIDLGGHGHHDGTLEPTLVELKDGRVMMLIRTSLDRFWVAFSEDQGRYWREIRPTSIEASSAPAWLTRLQSGRLAMAWNPLHAEGKECPRNGNPSATEFPASWYREELCLAFSDDDGKTWTKPVVIARYPGNSLAYPYVFEHAPGQVWVMTYYGKPHIALQLNENDFITPAKP